MSEFAELLGMCAYALIATGVWVVGDWRKAGWSIGLLGNLLLISYGWFSSQEGFLVMPLVAASAQVRHLVRWRHESWSRLRPRDKAPAAFYAADVDVRSHRVR